VQSRGIHHLDLVVTDVERSKQFYSELLRGLGWAGVLELEGERGEPIWYLQAQDTWIGLREKQSDAHPVPYERYAIGVHHLAFGRRPLLGVGTHPGSRDRKRSQGVPALRRWVLRRVFPRPGRDQARGRPRADAGSHDVRLTALALDQ
jgi:catechol 2,3-dioxygenase-like lactoylglutathione lyase family enzyme